MGGGVTLYGPEGALNTSELLRLIAALSDRLGLIVPAVVPRGGTTGQVLAKGSNADYDDHWTDPSGGGGGGGGAPTDVNYLVGTASAGLSAEIVVGTSPGGELGGTWANPTVDATHSGSSHADVAAAALAAAVALVDDLSGVTNAPQARTNLGLGTAATRDVASSGNASATQVVKGDDGRMTDARTPTAHAHTESDVTGLVADLALKAPLASPALTGTPTGPTAAQGTNTTQLATTAFVSTEVGLLVPKSLVDAKGDLIVATAADAVTRLAVGTNGQVLTADSAQATGMMWATPSGSDNGAAPNALPGSPPLALWLDAGSISGLSDGDPVGQWDDLSGNSRHLTQATAGKKPLYRSARPWFNGLPAVEFDGTDDTLTNLASGLTSGSAYTIACVAYVDFPGSDHMLADMRGSAYLDLIVNAGGRTRVLRAGSSAGTIQQVIDPTGINLLIGTYDGATAALYAGANLANKGALSGAMTLSSIYIGSNADVADWHRGDIAALALFTSALTPAQRLSLTRHWAHKFGLAGVA